MLVLALLADGCTEHQLIASYCRTYLYCSWLKAITQKSKALIIMLFRALIIFAIHNLSLFRMQCLIHNPAFLLSMLSNNFSASSLLLQWITISSAYRSNGFCGCVSSIHLSKPDADKYLPAQRTNNSTLRCSFCPCCYASIFLLYTCFQPSFCIQQYPFFLRMLSKQLHHNTLTDVVKEPFYIHI